MANDYQPVPLVPNVRGVIDLIYGEFGGGKNTLAAKIVREALEEGTPVFSSFPVHFNGYDETQSRWALLLRSVGLKTQFLVVPKENFHRLTMQEISEESFARKLFHMQKCVVVIDEGYAARLLDSYRKTNVSVDARIAVYTTRHFDRRFIIVAQRPNAIHVSSRAMVNRFYRCSQPLGDNTVLSNFFWRITGKRWFIFTEYQDMIDDSVDEEKPYRSRWILAGKKLLNYFDSKYMAEGYSNDYPTKATLQQLPYFTAIKRIFTRRSALALGASTPQLLAASPIIAPQKTIRSIKVIQR